MSRSLLLCASALLVLGASGAAFAADAKPDIGNFGFDAAGMNRSVKPGDDFVAYTSGKYLADLQIPADQTRYGMFTKLRDLSDERTRKIVEAAATSKATPGSEAQKVGDFYASFMDEAAIEARGIAPLKPMFAKIDAVNDRSDLVRLFGEANRLGTSMPVNVGISPDRKNPDAVTVTAVQGGLGLPDRDYFLDQTNPKFAEARTKYQAHIARMLALAGFDNAEVRAKSVYDLEAKIAASHWTRVERRQAEKTYNPVARGDLAAQFPGVDWTALLRATSLNDQPTVVVSTPSAIAGAAKLVASEPIAVWQDYLRFRAINDTAAVLPKAFVDADFDFNRKTLGGQPEIQPRWKRGVAQTSGVLGEAIGKLYTAEYFPSGIKGQGR